MLKKIAFAAILLFMVLGQRLLVYAYADANESPPGDGGIDDPGYGGIFSAKDLPEEAQHGNVDAQQVQASDPPPTPKPIVHQSEAQTPQPVTQKPITPETTKPADLEMQTSDHMGIAEKDIGRVNEPEPSEVTFEKSTTPFDAINQFKMAMFLWTGNNSTAFEPNTSHGYLIDWDKAETTPKPQEDEEDIEEEDNVFFWTVMTLLAVFVGIPLLIAIGCCVSKMMKERKRHVYEDSDDEEETEQLPGKVLIVAPEMIV